MLAKGIEVRDVPAWGTQRVLASEYWAEIPDAEPVSVQPQQTNLFAEVGS